MSWGVTLLALAIVLVVNWCLPFGTARDELVPIACRTPSYTSHWEEAEDAAPTMAMARD